MGNSGKATAGIRDNGDAGAIYDAEVACRDGLSARREEGQSEKSESERSHVHSILVS